MKTILSKLKHPHAITIILLIAAVGIFSLGSMILWASTLRLPDFDVFEERKVEQSTKIYDRTGNVLLYDLHQNMQRTVVPLEEIARHLKNATVAIEDAEFYEHNGIKIRSIIRAVLVNLGSVGFTQGGSTITQQVIKNSLLTKEKTISRKIKEWALAIKLEQKLSKEEILSLYLNEAPYGGNIYGAEEASRTFFGKKASEINLAEAAYLAALPQAPTFFSPYGNNRERLEERKNLVLARMKDNGFITGQEYDTAMKQPVVFKPRSESGIKAPHFVFYVREYLEQKYGGQAIEEDGLRVITTLDYDLQQKAEEILKKGALENEKNFNASNAGIVAIDPKTGGVLAMVGSRDYFDENIDGNFNITLAKRQPGSAFKPFVYATAFQKGYTPETILFDLQTQFSTACSPTDFSGAPACYSPGNYDGIFRGPVTIREALAQSINVPAVKALYLAGINNSIRTAQALGITTLTDSKRYGLSLVLGGGEVTLLEMTGAYGAFANEGIRNPINPILKIETPDGETAEAFTPQSLRAIDKNVALQISDILSDNAARSPAFGERSSLYFAGAQVAAKTGTTNDYRDAWIVGYTPGIAAGAWAGNNDNTPMEKKVAGFIIAPMWHEFMEFAIEKYPGDGFPAPTTDIPEKPVLRGIWQGGITSVSGSVPVLTQSVHSILHWVNKDDPRGPAPANPAGDPQYSLWEPPVRAWARAKGYGEGSQIILPGTVPQEQNDSEMRIRISSLDNEYDEDDTVRFTIRSNDDNPLSHIEIFINDTYIDTDRSAPFTFSFKPEEIQGIKKDNTLRVVGYDADSNQDSIQKNFSVE